MFYVLLSKTINRREVGNFRYVKYLVLFKHITKVNLQTFFIHYLKGGFKFTTISLLSGDT